MGFLRSASLRPSRLRDGGIVQRVMGTRFLRDSGRSGDGLPFLHDRRACGNGEGRCDGDDADAQVDIHVLSHRSGPVRCV